MRFFFSSIIVLALLVPDSSSAQDEPPAEYEQLIEQALAESAASRFEEARVLFRRAHEVFPNARALRGIGMVAFEIRDYPDAIRSLRAALAHETRPLTEEQRAEATQILERAYGFVGRYELSAVPEGARILVDGREAEVEPDRTLLLAVGRHQVEVRTATRSWDGAWTVRGGEQEPLPIVFDAPAALADPGADVPAPPATPPPSAPDTTAPAVLTIAGAILAVAGAVMLAVGVVDLGTVENAADGTSWASLSGAYERAAPLTGVGTVSLAVGGAAAIAGGIWLGVAGASPAPQASLGLRWGLRW